MKLRLMLLIAAGVVCWQAKVSAASHTITASGFSFSPSTLTIPTGDTVQWVNGGGSHTTTSGSACTTNGLWNASLGLGQSFSRTFNASGSFPFFCTPHCPFGMTGNITVTNAAVNVAPSVTITNPISGAKFAAPASFVLKANATDSDGSVTNVELFSNGTSLGNATAAPFNFLVNNLAAGNYKFTAKASDNLGATATSAVVNVYILTNAVLSAPLRTNGQFQFTIHGISNQMYTTEASSNLANWFSISTNIAPSDIFDVLDPNPVNGDIRFYRVRQDF